MRTANTLSLFPQTLKHGVVENFTIKSGLSTSQRHGFDKLRIKARLNIENPLLKLQWNNFLSHSNGVLQTSVKMNLTPTAYEVRPHMT